MTMRASQERLVALLCASLLAVAACGRGEAPRRAEAEDRPGRTPGGFIPDSKPAPPIRWSEETVPAGTAINVELEDPLSSATSSPGDTFRARVTDAVMGDGQVVVPAGSTIEGTVSEVAPAKRGFKDKGGALVLEVRRIRTPFGAEAEISGRISQVGAGSAGRNAAIIAGSALGGAVLSKVLDRNIKTGVLAGAVVGTAIAAGTRGREAEMAAGTPLTIVLEEPLRIRVRQ
jgi:hypothetical protein